MKCLVIGGAGFIGSNLVDGLLEQGHEVAVIDDLTGGKLENLEEAKEKITFYKKDMREPLQEIFDKEKPEACFLLAAKPRVPYSIEHPKETHEINVNGFLNVLMHCKKNNCKKFIFSSSGSVYGDQDVLPYKETMLPDPVSPYALHKYIGELYCKQFSLHYGMQTISLRYFNVYGERMDPIGGYALLIGKCIHNFMKDEEVLIYGNGEQTRDFTYVKDVVKANIAAMNCTNKKAFGEAFNTGAGNNISVNTVVKKIKEEIGKGTTKTMPPRIEPKHAQADPTKAKELLGYEATVNFEEGITKTIQWFKENY